jgi:hypothetical protein
VRNGFERAGKGKGKGKGKEGEGEQDDEEEDANDVVIEWMELDVRTGALASVTQTLPPGASMWINTRGGQIVKSRQAPRARSFSVKHSRQLLLVNDWSLTQGTVGLRSRGANRTERNAGDAAQGGGRQGGGRQGGGWHGWGATERGRPSSVTTICRHGSLTAAATSSFARFLPRALPPARAFSRAAPRAGSTEGSFISK